MKGKRRLICAFFILTVAVSNSYGQDEPDKGTAIAQPIPPSPNAASLGKYGEVPVSLYTGTPDINVPIWTVSEGDIKLPISLSYHASGIKVEQDASWVGLGWSLNAGGVITRTMRGKVDELGYFKNIGNGSPAIPDLLLNPSPSSTPTDCDTWSAANYAYNVGQPGGYDSEPDMYFFNFNGFSGRFVFDQDGNPYTIPYQNIRIQRVDAYSWVITTPDGIKYKFGSTGFVETSSTFSVTYPYYGWPVSSKDETALGNSFVSSWYLREIESPTGHTVDFSYAAEQYATNSGMSQQFYYNTITPQTTLPPSVSSVLTKFAGLRLSSIGFSNGSVVFTATKQRDDMSGDGTPSLAAQSFALENITIMDVNSNPLRKFVLNTSYFNSSDAVQNFTTKRLKLNSIAELSGDGTVSKPPYVFTYDEAIPLPAKNSSSQDDWGYYNGKTNIDDNGYPVLIPSVLKNHFTTVTIDQYWTSPTFQSIPFIHCPNLSDTRCAIHSPTLNTFEFHGADRSYDFNYAKTGMLTRMQYPTGGYSAFEYEANDYDLKNYVYQTASSQIQTFASCIDPSHPSIPNGDYCYANAEVSPSTIIPTAMTANNALVSFNISFTFNLDGNNNICCKCGSPYGNFIDLTTGVVLIQADGFSGITFTDASIQNQIEAGGVSYVHPNNSSFYAYNNIMLDPSHTYQLRTFARDCTALQCNEQGGDPQSGCPTPVPRHMEGIGNATFAYLTNEIVQYNGVTAGIRIKKITSGTNSSDNLPTIKKFVYRLSSPGDEQKSSGVLIDYPVYLDVQSLTGLSSYSIAPMISPTYRSIVNSFQFDAYSLTSGSKFELGQTNGSFIGYKEVQEISCPDDACTTNPLGKDVYQYSSPDDYPDANKGVFGYVSFNQPAADNLCPISGPGDPRLFFVSTTDPSTINPVSNVYPYPAKTSLDWKRGLLTSQSSFDKNGVLVKKTEHAYNLISEPNNRKVISALKIIHTPLGEADFVDRNLFYGRYDMIAAWNYKTQEKTTEIDPNGHQKVTTTNFYYDNPVHALLTRTTTLNSKGELLTNVTRYPMDFPNLTATDNLTLGVKNLQDNYVLMAPVERYEQKSDVDGSNMRTTGGIFYAYNTTSTLPNTVYQLQSASPVVGFSPANLTAVSVSKDSRYQPRIYFDGYDNSGNILQQHKIYDANHAYVWDYHSNYPTAEGTGATQTDIAFTSFEADAGGNWNFAAAGRTIAPGVSGSYCYNFSGGQVTNSNSLNASKTFLISVWAQSTPVITGASLSKTGRSYNGFTYYEFKTNAGVTSLTINGTGLIDELRLYPADAQMTSYTYIPMVGMSTKDDASGKLTYYQYDKLGMLQFIRDQDGNIVQRFDYQYQQP